jgi:hypothetical protein
MVFYGCSKEPPSAEIPGHRNSLESHWRPKDHTQIRSSAASYLLPVFSARTFHENGVTRNSARGINHIAASPRTFERATRVARPLLGTGDAL